MFSSKLRICAAVLCLALLAGCQRTPESAPSISFYHWKSDISSDSTSVAYLDALTARKLYVRFFDIKWMKSQGETYPEAVLHSSNGAATFPQEIVPTIYITNEAMRMIAPEDIAELAQHIKSKIREIHDAVFGVGHIPFNEVQLDCDWTKGSRNNFFALLEALRQRMPETRLSCTIRLHQFKYPDQTGVPPVDHGSLMCYNMGDLGNINEPNSILNLENARKYLLPNTDYPLPLSIALPLFSWGIQYRSDKPVQLINGVGNGALSSNPALHEIAPNHFEVRESTFLSGTYVYAGDVIRTEQVTLSDLKALMGLIDQSIRTRTHEIIFYHLDREILETYPIHELETLR